MFLEKFFEDCANVGRIRATYEGFDELCFSNSDLVKIYARLFLHIFDSFSISDDFLKKNWGEKTKSLTLFITSMNILRNRGSFPLALQKRDDHANEYVFYEHLIEELAWENTGARELLKLFLVVTLNLAHTAVTVVKTTRAEGMFLTIKDLTISLCLKIVLPTRPVTLFAYLPEQRVSRLCERFRATSSKDPVSSL